jgi:GT2 family glycosyltransferase
LTTGVQPHNIHDVVPDRERGARLSVSVVIPVYNRPDTVSRTLESLAAQSPGSPKFDVHVADDGSTEDLRSVVESARGLDIHYHRRESQSFGAGQARNLGAAAARGDIVVFLDADCLVTPDFIIGHAAWHGGGGKTVAIGGRALGVMGSEDQLVDYRKRLRRRTAGLQHGTEMFRSFVTANVSLPLSLFHEVGGFDERFHRWGAEDFELGWRLWNAGAIFLDAEDVSVTHQREEDVSGGSEGRRRDKARNMGLITSLIPHRFYRKEPPGTIPVVPKVSVVLHDVPAGSSHEVWEELKRQPRSDFELIVVADVDDEEPLAGASAGDPRLTYTTTLAEGVELASGEYTCFLNGHGAPSRDLFRGMLSRLDKQPMYVTATVGYQLPSDQGGSVLGQNGARDVDRSWGADMPLCWFIRTREINKLQDAGYSVAELWPVSQSWEANLHWSSAAVRLPGSTRTPRPAGLLHNAVRRQELAIDVVTRKRSVTEAARVYVRTRRRQGPAAGKPHSTTDTLENSRPLARYIGWTGHYNLGDEVMVEAVRDLLPWADIETEGDPGRLLILGGGTLINRSSYLRRVMSLDTPSAERCVLGTGVASPDYWGILEDPKAWIRWLGSCVYVGVRGPHSYERLRSWGFEGNLEVSGDSALLIERPPVDKVPGRIVIAPLWTKGRLWGGSDEAVAQAMAASVEAWRSQGRDVVAMSSSPDDDGQILQIASQIGVRLLPFVRGYLDNQKAIETIASAEVVVGERLHACVIAAAVGTPFVPVEYRPKLRDFAASVGVEDFVIRTDELNEGLLTEHVRSAIERGTDDTNAQVELYRGRLRQAAGLIERSVRA